MLSSNEEENARSTLEHADEELSGSSQEESSEGIENVDTVLKMKFNKKTTEAVKLLIKC